MLVRDKLFIGGQWVAPSGKESIDVHNAGNGEVMGRIPAGGEKDVDAAVKAGMKAFTDWREWPIRERAMVLYRLREAMVKNIDELSWLVSHENGKIFPEAKAEVEKGIECVEYGCSLPNLAAFLGR